MEGVLNKVKKVFSTIDNFDAYFLSQRNELEKIYRTIYRIHSDEINPSLYERWAKDMCRKHIHNFLEENNDNRLYFISGGSSNPFWVFGLDTVIIHCCRHTFSHQFELFNENGILKLRCLHDKGSDEYTIRMVKRVMETRFRQTYASRYPIKAFSVFNDDYWYTKYKMRYSKKSS